jgi:hypothetical protein
VAASLSFGIGSANTNFPASTINYFRMADVVYPRAIRHPKRRVHKRWRVEIIASVKCSHSQALLEECSTNILIKDKSQGKRRIGRLQSTLEQYAHSPSDLYMSSH